MALSYSDKKLLEAFQRGKAFVDYPFKVTKSNVKKLKGHQKLLLERYDTALYGPEGIATGNKQFVKPRKKGRKKILQESTGFDNKGLPRIKGAFISTGPAGGKVRVRYDKSGKPTFIATGPDGYRQIEVQLDPLELVKDSDKEIGKVLAKVPPPDGDQYREVIAIKTGPHEMGTPIGRNQLKREVKRLMGSTTKGGSGLSPDLVTAIVFRFFRYKGTAKDYAAQRNAFVDAKRMKATARQARRQARPKANRIGKDKH